MASADNFETILGDVLREMGHVAEPSNISSSTAISQLGLDSLEMLEFLMLLEEKTGIEVMTDELDPDSTLSGLAELLRRKAA